MGIQAAIPSVAGSSVSTELSSQQYDQEAGFQDPPPALSAR
jgi:hypothetical protein